MTQFFMYDAWKLRQPIKILSTSFKVIKLSHKLHIVNIERKSFSDNYEGKFGDLQS